jgi:excisionase family DNA binding protein
MERTIAPLEPLVASAPRRPRLTRDDVLDAHEVANLLGLPISTALDYARRGLLPGHKIGRRWIFLRDEIEAAVRCAPAHFTAPAPHKSPPEATQARARTSPKRYPQAVPSAPPASQPTLFG